MEDRSHPRCPIPGLHPVPDTLDVYKLPIVGGMHEKSVRVALKGEIFSDRQFC